MIALQLSEKALEQLKALYKEQTKGIWTTVNTANGFGVMCNEEMIAEDMSLANAYFIDAMHAHFNVLIQDIEHLKMAYSLKEQEAENLAVAVETNLNQIEYWKSAHKAAAKANELLRNDLAKTHESKESWGSDDAA
jgi:hypothetical protein